MWSFFTKESFPYEIGEKDNSYVGLSIFSLHKGVRKSTGQTVSIFTFNVKGSNKVALNNAKTNVKKLKTLKHPSILTYIDSYEDENVIHLVTESVEPLLSYMEKLQNHARFEEIEEMYLRWGLKSISEAVAFLNGHEQRHNNIFHGTVFVDKSGSWKLGELGYMSSVNSNDPNPVKLLDNLSKYNTKQLATAPWSADFWGLGVLVWEVFNGEIASSQNLTQPRKIPIKLKSNFLELTNLNVNKQEAISRLIQSCSDGNLLVSTLDSFHNYHLKDKDVKASICKDLQSLVPKIPKDIILNKIYELMKQAYEFDSESSALFVPVCATISSVLTEAEYQNTVEQFIIKLFSSNDRATRLALLMKVELIVERSSKSSINELFTYVSTGFLDTNPKIRGETIKAFVHFAPKLSKKHLNDDTLRTLLQVQTKDPEDVIRTNTTICLGKIAHCLQPESRKKILISAFLHALKDPCPTVRTAGIQAFSVNHHFFPLETIAKNILPGLVYLTVDVDVTVRQNTFKTTKMLLTKLENVSGNPDLKSEYEKDVLSQPNESSSTSYWPFSSITTKFLKTLDIKGNSDTVNTEHPESEKGAPQNEKGGPQNENGAASLPKPNISQQERKEKRDLKPPFLVPEASEDDVRFDEDKSDWENDGWGDAQEEVLELPVRRNQDQELKKKAGPMKLGTRMSK